MFNAVNENGKVYFIDGQTGEAAVLENGYVQLFFMRTDGAQPTLAPRRGAR